MNQLEALQLQRSMFAWLALGFAEGSRERIEAITRVDITQWAIQSWDVRKIYGGDVIEYNLDLLPRLYTAVVTPAAVVSMPPGDWQAVDAALAAVSE